MMMVMMYVIGSIEEHSICINIMFSAKVDYITVAFATWNSKPLLCVKIVQ